MKRAPRVDQPVFPGVFVSRDGCELRGDRLFFEGRPVDGAVFVTSPSETHDRAQVDGYQDGRRIGSWQDPIAGIDMTCCYVGNDVDPDPPDTTAYLSHCRQTHRCTGVHRFLYGDTRGMVEYERKVGQAESYSIARDEWAISSLYRQVLRSSDESDAEASWSWFPDGSLRYVSVRMQVPGEPADRPCAKLESRWFSRDTALIRGQSAVSPGNVEGGTTASVNITFDLDGCAEELTVRGPYWQLIAAHRVEAERWIPRTELELVDLDFAAECKLRSLDQSPSLLASAHRWLANVGTLASVTTDVDFGLIRRLCGARDFDSLRLADLGSLALLEFGLEFMRQRPGRTVEFGGVLFTTMSDLERTLRTWHPYRGLVVLDDDVRNVVVLEGVMLSDALADLAVSSEKLELCNPRPPLRGKPDRLHEIAAAAPDAAIFRAGRPLCDTADRAASQPVFENWLATTRSSRAE